MSRLLKVLVWTYVVSIPFEALPLGDTVGTPQKILAAATGATWVAYILLDKRGRLRVAPGIGWLIAFSVWAFVSVNWAAETEPAIRFAVTIFQLVLFTTALMDICGHDDVLGLFRAYTVSATLAAGLALVRSRTSTFSTRVELFGEIGPAHFAASLTPAALFLLSEVGAVRPGPRQAVLLVAEGVLLYALLRSGTRSALLGLIVGAVVMASRRRRLRLPVLALMVTLAGSIVLSPQLHHRVFTTSLETGGSGRLDIWRVGWSIFAEHPLWGVGISNFASSFTWDMIRRSGAVVYPAASAEIVPGRDAHNIFLQIAAELGVIGFMLFMIPTAGALVRGMRAREPQASVTTAALTAYLAQGFFLPILSRKYFWFVLALTLVSAGRQRASQPSSVLAEQLAKKGG